MLQTSLVWLLFHGTAKTKPAMLAFLYYGEFVKNSIVLSGDLKILYVGNCR